MTLTDQRNPGPTPDPRDDDDRDDAAGSSSTAGNASPLREGQGG